MNHMLILSPKDYLKLYQTAKAKIKSVTYLPPKFTSRTLKGKFLVDCKDTVIPPL